MEILLKKSLFWDVDREKLSCEKDWFFIIERILEFGDIDDFFRMKETFPEEKVREVVLKSRIISKRTCSFCRASGYAF